MTHIAGYKESLEPLKPSDQKPVEEFTGYGQYIVPRPKLHDLLLKQVPSHKVHFGKRVLNISEKNDKVTIETADNSYYEGDIVHMYEALRTEEKLPKSDQEDLPFNCTCLIGQTKALDPEQFPIVKEPTSQYHSVFGENSPFTWTIFNTAQNTLCWTVIYHLDKKTSKVTEEQRLRNNEDSEWDAHPAQTMCNETRHFPLPLREGKMTMGDLYDLTEKELISKVMLEEKVFKTWYSGRTVLLGDACHKLNPWGGHGAVKAIHDAIALANLFYAMPIKTSQEATKVLRSTRRNDTLP
ncbi:hypothetical protein BGX33_011878 [Mortierella sp. NVP41]|nr:hypothetical protein BGX33_011878 [Mortierella sp. NVP41]